MVDAGLQYIKSKKPPYAQLDSFIDYFETTWVNKYPPKMWNHYDTTTPRTNNHVEAFNRSLSDHMDEKKPSIYQLITSLKTMEIQIASHFYKRTYNKGAKKHGRKSIDIERDLKIEQLKFRLKNNQIDMIQYTKSTAYLYSYEHNDKKEDKLPQPKPNLMLNQPHIQDISGKKYDFIKEYINTHRQKIIDMIKNIRNPTYPM